MIQIVELSGRVILTDTWGYLLWCAGHDVVAIGAATVVED